MRSKLILLFLFIFAFTFNVFADSVVLKNGQEISGKILENSNNNLKIDFEGVALNYSLDEIETINGEKVSLSAEVIESIVAMPEEAAVEVLEEESVQIEQPMDGKEMVAEQGEVEEVFTVIEPVESQSTVRSKQRLGKVFPDLLAKNAPVLSVAIISLILFAFLIVYIYSALCYYFIAKKTNIEPAWLAWVPIANLFLMCKIADVSYWWLLLIFAMLVPILNIFVNLGFFGFLGYKIALARSKPGWLGALMVLPLVGLVITGYLAFSE